MARSQAANLSGMLGSIGDTLGKMGDTGNMYVETLRNQFRPELDMNDPKSMEAYAQWLMNNGQQEEGRKMMAQAAEVSRGIKSRNGQAAIMAMAGQLTPGMDDKRRAEIMTAIGQVANQTGIEPLEIQQLLESQNIQRRETGAMERNTDSMIADRLTQREQDQQRIDDNFNLAMTGYGLEQQRIEETIRSNLAGEKLTSRSMDIDEYQFGKTFGLEEEKFAEVQRMNTFRRWVGKNEIRQGDKSLSLEEARVEIARDLANEDIEMGAFKRVIMGNEDARAEDMHPIMRDLKKAQIEVATASAGYTEAQTADLLYELGFKRDTEDLRKDMMELKVEKTEQEILSERANTDYIKNRTKQITAEIELGIDRYKLAERTQLWNEGMQEAQLQLEERIANSQIDLRASQVNNLKATTNSTILRDELLVAKAESEKISQAYQTAYGLDIDLNNPNAIANAKRGFITAFGPEWAVDFDQAIEQRIKVQNLINDTAAGAALLADNKPKTAAQLEAAGMSPQDIDAYKLITDPAERNRFVQNWAQRMNTKEVGGAPTNALMEIYAGAAERMQKDIFGSGFLWSGAFNGVWDNDVREDITLAMASAAAANKTANEVWLAGLEATFPYLQEAGSASSAQAAKGYADKYGDN